MFRVVLPCFLIISILNCVLCSSVSNSSPPCQLHANGFLTSLVQEAYAASFEGSSELDPMFQNQIDASLPTLVYSLTDSTVKGFRSCQMKDTSLSPDKTSVHVNMFCPRYEMLGHYVADGAIETMPFQGNGEFTMSANGFSINLDLNIETSIKNGKKYTKIMDYQVEADLTGDMDFKVGNLFRGNTALSAVTHKFIKENPKRVLKVLQKPVLYANFKKLIEALNKHMESTTVDLTK